TNPYDGQAAYNRGTDRLYVYDGANWQPYCYTAKLRLERASSTAISLASNSDHTYTTAWDAGAGAAGIVVNIGNDVTYPGGGILQVTKAGEYDAFAGIAYGSGTGVVETKFAVNGNSVAYGRDRRHIDSAHQTNVAIQAPMTLNAGDQVTF